MTREEAGEILLRGSSAVQCVACQGTGKRPPKAATFYGSRQYTPNLRETVAYTARCTHCRGDGDVICDDYAAAYALIHEERAPIHILMRYRMRINLQNIEDVAHVEDLELQDGESYAVDFSDGSIKIVVFRASQPHAFYITWSSG